MRPLWISTLLVSLTLCACEPPISGAGDVVDGDSLRIDGTSIRVFGIDAPEGRQTCLRDGAAWACGEAAAAKLRTLVDGRSIACTQRDIDAYGRVVATCTNGSVDLGREMVLDGLALAYRQYGEEYVDEENEARAGRRGIWAGDFTPPWDWRRDPGPATARATPAAGPSGANDGCLVKGNINREGVRIYHVPGSSSYEQTVIDPERGERWFCSEAEAQSAGWRAPQGR